MEKIEKTERINKVAKLINEKDKLFIYSAYIYINYISDKSNIHYDTLSTIDGYDLKINMTDELNVSQNREKTILEFLEKCNEHFSEQHESSMRVRVPKNESDTSLRFFYDVSIPPIDEIFNIYIFLNNIENNVKPKSVNVYGDKIQSSIINILTDKDYKSNNIDNLYKTHSLYIYYWKQYQSFLNGIENTISQSDSTLVIKYDIVNFYNEINLTRAIDSINNHNIKECFKQIYQKEAFKEGGKEKNLKLSPSMLFSRFIVGQYMNCVLNNIHNYILEDKELQDFDISIYCYVDDFYILVNDCEGYIKYGNIIDKIVKNVLKQEGLKINTDKLNKQYVVDEEQFEIDSDISYEEREEGNPNELVSIKMIDLDLSKNKTLTSTDLNKSLKYIYDYLHRIYIQNEFKSKKDMYNKKTYEEHLHYIHDKIYSNISIFFMCFEYWVELFYLDKIYVFRKLEDKDMSLFEYIREKIENDKFLFNNTKMKQKVKKSIIKQIDQANDIAEKLYLDDKISSSLDVKFINIIYKYKVTDIDIKSFEMFFYLFDYESTLIRLTSNKYLHDYESLQSHLISKNTEESEKFYDIEKIRDINFDSESIKVSLCSIGENSLDNPEKKEDNYYNRYMEAFSSEKKYLKSSKYLKEENYYEKNFEENLYNLQNSNCEIAFFPEHTIPVKNLSFFLNTYKPTYDIVGGLTPIYKVKGKTKIVLNLLIYIKYVRNNHFSYYEITLRDKKIYSDNEKNITENWKLDLYKNTDDKLFRIVMTHKKTNIDKQIANSCLRIVPFMCYEVTDFKKRISTIKEAEIVSLHSHNTAESHFDSLTNALCLDGMMNIIGINYSQYGGVYIKEPQKSHNKQQLYLKNRYYSSVLFANIDYANLIRSISCNAGNNIANCCKKKNKKKCSKCSIKKHYKNNPPNF